MSLTLTEEGFRGLLAGNRLDENALVIAQALADYLIVNNKKTRVAVAFDGRTYSQELAHEFASVLAGNGLEVFYSDKVIPLPVLSFGIKSFECSIGILISAGVKTGIPNEVIFRDDTGGKLNYSDIKAIEGNFGKSCVEKNEHFIETADFVEPYFEELDTIINCDNIKNESINILIDSMYGSGKNFIDQFLSRHDLYITDTISDFSPGSDDSKKMVVKDSFDDIQHRLEANSEYSMGIATSNNARKITIFLNGGQQAEISVVNSLLTEYIKLNNRMDTDCMEFDGKGGFVFKHHLNDFDGIVASLLLIEFLGSSERNKLSDMVLM